jgi:hypothetical protein
VARRHGCARPLVRASTIAPKGKGLARNGRYVAVFGPASGDVRAARVLVGGESPKRGAVRSSAMSVEIWRKGTETRTSRLCTGSRPNEDVVYQHGRCGAATSKGVP